MYVCVLSCPNTRGVKSREKGITPVVSHKTLPFSWLYLTLINTLNILSHSSISRPDC